MALRILVALVLLMVVEQASAALYTVADKPSIIAVGDGLTESAFSSVNNGWGLLMQQKYIRKVILCCEQRWKQLIGKMSSSFAAGGNAQ
jgi:hypothetical protein